MARRSRFSLKVRERALALLACGVLFWSAGCDRFVGPTLLVPVERLVELGVRVSPPIRGGGGTVAGPERQVRVESIADEARPVLRGYPAVWLYPAAPTTSRDGDLVRWFHLPGSLRDVERVVVVGRATVPGTKGRIEGTLLVHRGQGETRVEARTALSSELLEVVQEQPVGLDMVARVHVPPQRAGERIDTSTIRIPAGARLEVGFGLLPLAWDQGAVEFRLSVCVRERCAPLLSETLDPAEPAARAWQDRSLALGAYRGMRIAFRFETFQRSESDDAYTFPVWSHPEVLALARPPGRSNLLLISLDTLRADHLPSYGYALDTAPFIESRLAREGVLFENAVTAATTTAPSHMTLFTSRQPTVHGVHSNIDGRALPANIPTLAQVLERLGFATGAVTENGALRIGSGIERGFQSYRENRPKAGGEIAVGLVESTLSAGRAWLERHRDRRFLLFLHTYEVHTPYRPPDRFAFLGPDDESAGRWRDLRAPKWWRPENYDREICYTDDALRAFIEGLERDGLLDDTLVVLFSDHGEAFLEHGYLHHGGGVHEEVLRVPLLFWGSGAARGLRVSAPVGLVDLMPTLLELVGAPAPPSGTGRSFASLVRGEPAAPSWEERPLYSEAWRDERGEVERDGESGEERLVSVELYPPALMVRKGSRKMIRVRERSGYRYHYYDLARDPKELVDLYPGAPTLAADLRALLERYESDMKERRRALGGEPFPSPSSPLEPDREEALRALGYLE